MLSVQVQQPKEIDVSSEVLFLLFSVKRLSIVRTEMVAINQVVSQ